jgi:TonB family protein
MFMPPAGKAVPLKASDDPVLADLESDSPTPVFSSYAEPKKKKTSGALVAVLVLAMAGSGLYAAWMYVPEFRQIAQPQIDRLMALVGHVSPSQPTPSPRPVPATAATASSTQPVAASASSATAAAAEAAPDGSTTSTAGSTNAGASSAPAGASTTTPVPTTAATIPSAEAAKSPAAADSKKGTALEVAALPEAELPQEKSAVILSSQGAEKRLLRHVPPAYPTEARKNGIEGTVVLKTVVSETGVVEGVRLVEGNPALAAAAITSVKQWRYRPYVRDGKAQPFQTIVLVEFQRP